MAITTDNGKLAIMEWEDVWEPGLPFGTASSPIDQAIEEQFLWGFGEILWAAGSALAFILDLNTRLFVYGQTIYAPGSQDLTTMLAKNLASRTGDMSIRWRELVDDATP